MHPIETKARAYVEFLTGESVRTVRDSLGIPRSTAFRWREEAMQWCPRMGRLHGLYDPGVFRGWRIGTCGAKTRSGGRCQNYPMANGRCRMHGGASLKGTASKRYKHGRYSKYT